MNSLENLSKEELIQLIHDKEQLILDLSKEKYFSDLKYETDVIVGSNLIASSLLLKEVFDGGGYKSLRQFATKVQLPAGKLSEIFSGKRFITPVILEKIKDSNHLTDEVVQKVTELVAGEIVEREKVKSDIKDALSLKPAPVEDLDGKSFCFMDDWTFYAILAVLEKEESCQDADWVASSLNISVTQAQRSLDMLLSLKLVEKKENGFYLSKQRNTFNSNKPEEAKKALRKLTNSIIRKSQTVYNELELPMDGKADYINFSLLADPDRIDSARKMLANYLYKVAQYLNEGDKNKSEVYYLNAQLFPVVVDKAVK